MLKMYRQFLQDRSWLVSVGIGLGFLLASFAASIASNRYASRVAGAPVGDLILDHIPVWDVGILHIYVATLFWLGVLGFVLCRPGEIPFALKTTALFLFVRSAFVIMTHIGPPENLLVLPSGIAALYIYNGDLFFSGHAGGPFLFALIFWAHAPMRWLCLSAAAFFSAMVLLGAIHYSIDVFASFFIAHSVHVMSCRLFERDLGWSGT